jgi:outer membrane usher protein
LKNVPIYLENTVVAHTDAHGLAVVSNLQPYQASRISIDPLTLPMNVSVNEVEKKVVPRSRGGVWVDFELRTVHAAIVRVIFADGTPLTPWTTVSEVGTDRTFVSGLRGEVAVELSALKGNRLRLLPAGRATCEVIVDLPESDSLVPTIGPLTCVAIQ